MNKDKINIPELRFSEFLSDGNWEERFVEEFFSVGSSKRVLQEDWTSSGVPFYRTRELVSLSKNEPFGSEIFISEDLFIEISEKYGIPNEGDFLVSGVGTLGICYQVKVGDRFYFKDGNVLWFKLESGIDSTYFKFCFQSDYIQKQIVKQTSISTVGTYTIQNAKKTTLWYPPKLQEQQKIASCLSSLDEVISAHSQKLELLKDHKKGLMQNLFPQEGEKLPKLRFSDDDSWKEVCLPSMVYFQEGPGIMAVDFRNEGVPLVRLSGIGGSTVSLKGCNFLDADMVVTKWNHFRLSKNDLVISTSATFGLTSIVDEVAEGSVFYTGLIRFRPINDKIDLQYLKAFLGCPLFERQAKFAAVGGGIKHFGPTHLKQMTITLPSVQEQQKIASCLSSLDALITAQAENIEQLKLHKKGLMQGLFPKIND